MNIKIDNKRKSKLGLSDIKTLFPNSDGRMLEIPNNVKVVFESGVCSKNIAEKFFTNKFSYAEDSNEIKLIKELKKYCDDYINNELPNNFEIKSEDMLFNMETVDKSKNDRYRYILEKFTVNYNENSLMKARLSEKIRVYYSNVNGTLYIKFIDLHHLLAIGNFEGSYRKHVNKNLCLSSVLNIKK